MFEIKKMSCDSGKKTGVYYFFSFAIPSLLVLLCLIALQVTPFGNKSLMISDANAYYMPYISYCKTIFSGTHNAFYSFCQDIGGGISATIWPYLINPFTWIIAFFEYEFYGAGYTFGIVLVSALYGLSMYILLEDIYGNKVENLLISTCYAISGFAVAYNIYTAFFFGGPLFLPLMVLGLRKIFRKESPALYIFAIAYPVMLQIQMGFAICMAAVLFFIANLYVGNHMAEIKNLFMRFICASIAGGMIGAIIWIPEMIVIKQGRGELSLEDFVFSSNAPLLQFGTRLFTGANNTSQIAYGFPAVFCGILPVALVILYFLNNNIEQKYKKTYAVLLLIYLLGFYIRTFTSIYQGFTHANWFNYRFSFVFIFILLMIASEQLNRLEEVNMNDIKRCGSIVLIFALIVFILEYEFVDGAMVVFDLGILTVIGGSFLFYKKAPDMAPKRILVLFMCLCTYFQLYLNYYLCNAAVFKEWKDTGTHYTEYIIKKEPMIRAIQTTDDGFYRIESEQKLDGSIGNDSFFLDYNGVGFAGHTERKFVSIGLSKLGLDFWSGCWNSYNDGIPAATDALLGIKYMLSERDLAEEKGYIKKADLEGLGLYENPYVIPIGFVSDDGIAEVDIEQEKDVFKILNAIWNGLSGNNSNIFTEETDICYSNHNPTDVYNITHKDVMNIMEKDEDATLAEGDANANLHADNYSSDETSVAQRENTKEDNRYKAYVEYSFTAKKTGPIYLYDGASVVEETGSAEDVMQYVGYFTEGEYVSGKLYLNYTVTEQVMIETVKDLHICYADQELLQEYCAMINNRQSTIVKESDSKLSGDVTVTEGQLLFFSIPYDEGWTLTVDGVETELEKTADLFMSAILEPGFHHYEMTYEPVGFKAGIAACAVGIILLIILCAVSRKRREITIDSADNEDYSTEENDETAKKARKTEISGENEIAEMAESRTTDYE